MKKKIIVIERDRDILQIIEIILTNQDYQVFSIPSELGAVQKIIEIKPHAILLDVISPTADGTQLCKAIKATPEITNIPLIVLSTHFDIKSVKSICGDDILSKPFDINELIEAVNKQAIHCQ
ncbi:MAG: response regulator [Pyrinomonadaceae bacterium]|nr:response regulator [Sphingobacteriaceae bacterium]